MRPMGLENDRIGVIQLASMSNLTYHPMMGADDKPVAWLHGEIKTPPWSRQARRNVGWLLRRVQEGELLSLPASRPMPSVGPRCHELRISDLEKHKEWRIVYRIDDDAIVIADVFAKTSRATPRQTISACRKRLRIYDSI